MAGVQHYELGQLDEALKHYDMAIEKDNQNGQFFYNRGLVHSRLDKVEKAIEDYTNALKHVSEQDHIYQARFNRGICERRMGPSHLD